MQTATVKEYADKYLMNCRKFSDYSSRKSIIGHFVRVLGDKNLNDLEKKDCDKFIEQQLLCYKSTTVNSHCRYASRMLKLAKYDKLLEENPFDLVSKPKTENRGRSISIEEQNKIIRGKPNWFRSAVIFSVETGVRQGELIGLERRDLDLNTRFLRMDVSKTKGGKLSSAPKPRRIPLTEDAILALGCLESMHETERLFTGPYGPPISSSTLKDNWTRATQFIAPDRPVWHDLRHTWATRLVESGTDAMTLQALAGWTSISMAQRYVHLGDDHLRMSTDRLERHNRERIAV